MRLFFTAIMLGFLACGYEPVEPPPSLTPADLPPSPSSLAEFAGDTLGVARTSRVVPLLSEAGSKSYVQLANARIVTSAQIALSAYLSPHALAFRQLLQEKNSRAAFLAGC